jgi:TetR/AcrR family transcriptional regulator
MVLGEAPSRRDRILAAAANEFALHGFSGARVERIAAAANVNKQLLFHYFRSKAGLHRAVVQGVVERFVVDVPVGGLPAERMRRLAAQLGSAASAHPALVSMLSAPGTAADESAEALQLAREWRSRAARSAAQVLEDGQRAGYVRDDADLDLVAEVIVAASLGAPVVGDGGHGSWTAGRGEQFTETVVRMALDYCGWR